jgi:hypothetical protein
MMKAAVRFAVHLPTEAAVFTVLPKNMFTVTAARSAYIAVPEAWGRAVSTVPTASMNGERIPKTIRFYFFYLS